MYVIIIMIKLMLPMIRSLLMVLNSLSFSLSMMSEIKDFAAKIGKYSVCKGLTADFSSAVPLLSNIVYLRQAACPLWRIFVKNKQSVKR